MNMILINESEYEKMIISKVVDLGWEYKNYEEVFALRNHSSIEVLLVEEIKSFLTLSQKLSNEQINEVLRKLKDLHGSSLDESNKLFTKYFIEGIKIKDKKNHKFLTIKLHDKTHNRLIVTNQFTMKSTHPEYKNQCPDIVLYLNGLPVVVIELKRPNTPGVHSLERAYQQIENYQSYLKNLFDYNIFNIISDGDISKVGTLSSSLSRYAKWRGADFRVKSSNIFEDLLKPHTLIELASQFTFYTKHNLVSKKIIAGYHQYYGVKKAIKSVLKAMVTNQKGGIFWHTQGSGKSYSMIFLSKIIAQKKPGTTFIVVTDRNDLDDQLYNNFILASNYLGQKIQKITSIKQLKAEIIDRKQDGIFFSTIQKFTSDVGVLITRENVVVISDEAHRSHNNVEGRYEIDLDKTFYAKKFGSAKYLRDAFPNATFIGFTGTPVEKEDTSTSRIFGNVTSTYTMGDGERDGVIVEINYESRKAEIHFNEKELNLLDKEDANLNKKLNQESMLPTEVKKKINKAIKNLKNFISDSNRIEGICKDLLKHYNSRKHLVLGKAMIVTLNRDVALKYYKTLIKLAPHLKSHIKLICTSNKQSDKPEMIELAGSSATRRELAIEFKNNDDSEFKIAIVVDMWLTGFDVPALDTLYLDKPLKMHNLMQTIARTNRVYNKNSIIKESGLVVDYIGIWKKLREALAFYSNQSIKATQPMHDINIFKHDALAKLDLIYSNFKLEQLAINFARCLNDGTYAYNSIEEITNEILSQKVQKQFVDASRIISKVFKKTISVLSEIEIIKFHLLLSSRQQLIKLAMDDIDFISIKTKMIDMLDDALKFTKTIVIDKFHNSVIKIKDINKYFNQSENDDKHKALRTKEKVSALKFMLVELSKISLESSAKLSNDLRQLLTRYDNNYITLEELSKGLIIIKNETDAIWKNTKQDHFTVEERNFFDVLSKPIKQTNYDQKKIKIILIELLKIVNNENLVNRQWIYNPILKRKTRASLKMLLKKHNYPPEQSQYTKERLIEAIMISKELNYE